MPSCSSFGLHFKAYPVYTVGAMHWHNIVGRKIRRLQSWAAEIGHQGAVDMRHSIPCQACFEWPVEEEGQTKSIEYTGVYVNWGVCLHWPICRFQVSQQGITGSRKPVRVGEYVVMDWQ